MLGQRVHDPFGVEGSGEGLGLLSVETTFEREKLIRRTNGRFASTLGGAWGVLADRELSGYEIRHGRTGATGAVATAIPNELGWVQGSVLGVTVHGLLEDPDILRALFGKAPGRSLDAAIDSLTDLVMASLDGAFVENLLSGAEEPTEVR